MVATSGRRPGQSKRGAPSAGLASAVSAAALLACSCSGFRAEPAQGGFQPYRDPAAATTGPATPTPPPDGARKLAYRARAQLLTRCGAPLELSMRRIEGERRGSEVTVVVEALVNNPHKVPVTIERQMKLRAGAGVELPFWQQFDGRRGRAVASNGGGLVLLPLDLRQNDGFTGPEQRTLPAGAQARTPTVTYKGLLGRGEERTLELLVASSAPPGSGTCRYRVVLVQR